MNKNEIHFFGLVGLRALAEYNPSEFKRSTDMSKRELERRIESNLSDSQNQSEKRDLYKELKAIIETTESTVELSFLLQQFYFTCLRKAQYYSLQNSKRKSERGHKNLSPNQRYYNYQAERPISSSQEKDLIRLSVMLLLRFLPYYQPIFEHRLRTQVVDCVLEPQREELPYIVIEAKSTISSQKQLENAASQIKLAVDFFGEKSIGVVVVENFSLNINLSLLKENFRILIFDSQRNEFINKEFSELITLINDY